MQDIHFFSSNTSSNANNRASIISLHRSYSSNTMNSGNGN